MTTPLTREGDGPRSPGILAQARDALSGLLNQHHQRGGIGSDAYHNAPIVHPMAEGRFLSAAASATRARLMTSDRLQAMASDALSRLESRARPFGGGIGWGLDFSWGTSAEDEPYLITSAVVTQGIHDFSMVLPKQPQVGDLLERALDGLAGWSGQSALLHPGLSVSLPAYSPAMRKPILNAAAYAAGVLCAAGREGGAQRQSLLAIRDGYLPGTGWPYDPDTPVIDLLHQCYILASLELGLGDDTENSAFCDRAVVETVALFSSKPGEMFDAARYSEERPDLPPIPQTMLRFVPAGTVYLKPSPARLWSLGELLAVLASRISAHRQDNRAQAWRHYATPVVETVLARLAEPQGEAAYPRHLMHVAWGLARLLEVLRLQAEERGSTVG